MNVTETIALNDSVSETLTYGSASSVVTSAPVPTFTYAFQNGTSSGGTVSGVVDLWWEKANATAVTLAASASVTYTMSALADDEGRTVAYARLRKFSVRITAKTPTANDALTIAPGATHGLTGIGTSSVTDAILLVWNNPAGLPVAAGSSDQITITNSGSNPITFFIRTTGCST